ncbi:hypothetical protein F3Y22_tig00111640pilonHSYRG00183 [Hibiscus syriacus]|uniref:Uncharacterized protein n=1 Tax=Hibiscus syriacus TaxID=106335 RepID=A0A6A2YJ33_HIBSY|nr:hypothetical protein F3Y22_tig00111640pilonHSYRG00183 [Hibiscus syriacus]
MEHSSMWRACASKRAFRIGVLCAILTPVAKVMAKRLKHTQNDPNKEHVTINSRLCADLPTHECFMDMLLLKLEAIYLFYCKALEEVVSEEEKLEPDSKAFSRLKTISILDLPELRSITPLALTFPCLKNIAVIDCPKLKRLSIRITHDSWTVPTVYCIKDWWKH